jgi:hypothetical protein
MFDPGMSIETVRPIGSHSDAQNRLKILIAQERSQDDGPMEACEIEWNRFRRAPDQMRKPRRALRIDTPRGADGGRDEARVAEAQALAQQPRDRAQDDRAIAAGQPRKCLDGAKHHSRTAADVTNPKNVD